MSGSSAVTKHRFGHLRVLIAPTLAEMAEAAAADVAGVLTQALGDRGAANAMFATGNSQLGMLARLTSHSVDWSKVRVFHMDEYVGMSAEHPASFARYIRERITEAVHPGETHELRGDAPDGPEAEAARYAELLHAHPLDLCVMGIGENGHLAFNDPPVADFDDPADVKVVSLDEACRRQQVGEGHFPSLAAVPERAITVTVPALLRAGELIVVCPDSRKAPAVREALTGPISTACPASVLRRMPHARLYLDAAAACLLPLA